MYDKEVYTIGPLLFLINIYDIPSTVQSIILIITYMLMTQCLSDLFVHLEMGPGVFLNQLPIEDERAYCAGEEHFGDGEERVSRWK